MQQVWLALIIGLIIGWLIEWLIDWRFWRKNVALLRAENAAVSYTHLTLPTSDLV